MVDYRANTQLEMRWSPVVDVKGRTGMQVRWIVPGGAGTQAGTQADNRADNRADTATLGVDAA